MGVATIPVVIAGGGPAGLAAAAELSYHGVACTVIEPRFEVSALRPRAKTTSVRTMEHFRRWGIAESIRAAAPIAASWNDRVIFCPHLSGTVITTVEDVFGLGPATLELSPELGQQIPQPVVERVLRDHLARSPLVTFRYGERVTEVRDDGVSVAVSTINDSGARHDVVADWAIGCDGASSVVRKSVGVPFTGTSDVRPNFNFVFRADQLVADVGDAVQYWLIGGELPIVAGRLDLNGLWWVIAPGIDEDTGIANTSRIVEVLAGHPIAHEVVSTDSWKARLLVADQFRSGRVFLVGESAHLNPPWGGHGFNTCVGDAVNLGWKLSAVIQGRADELLLDSYEAERRPIAVRTIDVARRNMADLPDALDGMTGSEIRSAKDAEFHSLGIVLGYTYGQKDQGRVTSYRPSSDPGGRLPHAYFPDGTALFDALDREYTVVAPAGTGVVELPVKVVEAPLDYPWGDEFLLVRPDQHIAQRAHRIDEIQFPPIATLSEETT